LDRVLPSADRLNAGSNHIKLDDARELSELEYFNIKLESHDVIYAEGARIALPEGISRDPLDRELRSRLRGAPWLDRREPIDVIRDRLEERAITLSQELEPSL
jgi:hypothetical protein